MLFKKLPTSGSVNQRRWLRPALFLLLTLAIVGAAVGYKVSSAKKEEPKKEEAKIFEFAQRDLATLAARELGHVIAVSGTLRPLTQAVVKSKVAGEVAKVHAQEGQRVAAGQVLVSLDTADLRARADAQLAVVAEMKARMDLASKNEANNRQLVAKNFISQNALDAVVSNAEVARANLKSAEAQAAISQRALADATIRAPFAGVVANRMVNIGEKVSPDMSVMQVVDLSRMEMEALIPVAEIPGVNIGQQISFTVDGFADRQFTGRVERINPSAEQGSRSIAVFVSIDNSDQSLKGGMFASGKLAAASKGPVSAIPLVALREEGGQSYVFTVEGDAIARKPVTVGTRSVDLGLVEIREGLSAGAQVVAVRMQGLKPGAKAILKAGNTVPTTAAAAAAATTSKKQ
jgi:membrane fusion protein, multidrug efflux system